MYRFHQVDGTLDDCYRNVVSGVGVDDVLPENKGHPISQNWALWAFRSSEGIVQETQKKGFIEETGLNKGEDTFWDFSKTTLRCGFSTNLCNINRAIAFKFGNWYFRGRVGFGQYIRSWRAPSPLRSSPYDRQWTERMYCLLVDQVNDHMPYFTISMPLLEWKVRIWF